MPIDDRVRQWFVLRVTPHTEIKVVQALRAEGLAGWSPVATWWRSGVAVSGPAFPGYLFAAIPVPAADHFGIVLGIVGVRGFLGGAEPEIVPGIVISTIQLRERLGHLDATRTRPPRTTRDRGIDVQAADRLVSRLGQNIAARAA